MEEFHSWIDRLATTPVEERVAVEQQIDTIYGAEYAVLAMDMSDFSLSVRRGGILPYLCRIRRMQGITRPIVEDTRGAIVKYQADNLLAVFREPLDALAAAVKIHQALNLPVDDPIPVAGGISWGRVLLIPGRECFGDAVNWAYKLGEDVAQAGEILLSAEFIERIGGQVSYALEPQTVSICGIRIPCHRLRPGA